jgi:hypothetical protein
MLGELSVIGEDGAAARATSSGQAAHVHEKLPSKICMQSICKDILWGGELFT